MSVLASIAISTWKRCELLADLIVSLENQTLSRSAYEINVYDSDSPDRTKALVQELADIYGNVNYFSVDVNAPAHKRNVAIHTTQTPFIIFMDDDLLASPQLLESHLSAHENTTGIVACGQVRFPSSLIATSNYFRFRDSRHLGPSRAQLDATNLPFQYVVVMNMSARTDELRSRVGAFSEQFVGYACEDYEYGYRIVKSGLRLVYQPEALAIHREASHGVSVFYNKMRSMARDSVPVLKQLVPPQELAGTTFLLEPIESADTFQTLLKKRLAHGIMNRYLATAALRYLEATDSRPGLYAPPVYQYLLAYAYYEGTQQRHHEQ